MSIGECNIIICMCRGSVSDLVNTALIEIKHMIQSIAQQIEPICGSNLAQATTNQSWVDLAKPEMVPLSCHLMHIHHLFNLHVFYKE